MIKKQTWGSSSIDPVKIERELLLRLRQLCHPDKHGGSPLSIKVWHRLEEVRKALDNIPGSK